MANSRRRKAALILTAVALTAVLVWSVLRYNNKTALGYIASTGVVEATEAGFGPRTSGTIEWLCCAEGDSVQAGQVLIKMESAGTTARLDEARAGSIAAHESVSEAKVGLEAAVNQNLAARSELEAATSEVERVKALADDAGRNIDRTRGLFKQGYVSARDMDSAEAVYASMIAQLSSAKARKRTVEANYKTSDIAIKSARVKISLAEARLMQAQAEVKVLESELADRTVSSTIDGVVAYKAFEAGENAVPGQAVYTVYDLGRIWVRVDLDEGVVARVLPGADTEIHLPADVSKRFKGKVTEIGVVGGFATQRDVTRGRSDIKTFRVKAVLEDPQGVLKPGMTAEVRIRTDNAGGGLKR